MKKIFISIVSTLIGCLALGYIYISFTSYESLSSQLKTVKKVDQNKNVIKNSENQNSDKKSMLDKIEISDYKTGFYPSSVWKPAIEIKFKNISGKNLNEFIKVQAVFVDGNTDEQLSSKSLYICNPYDTTILKDKEVVKVFKSDRGYRGYPSKPNVIVQLFIEGISLGQIGIDDREF